MMMNPRKTSQFIKRVKDTNTNHISHHSRCPGNNDIQPKRTNRRIQKFKDEKYDALHFDSASHHKTQSSAPPTLCRFLNLFYFITINKTNYLFFYYFLVLISSKNNRCNIGGWRVGMQFYTVYLSLSICQQNGSIQSLILKMY